MSEQRLEVADADAMEALGARLASRLGAGDLVLLNGELGAGKTTLTRGIGQALGARGQVTSPTFALVQRHGGGERLIYHLDLYRIEAERELDELGIEDMEEEGALLVVEWAEKLGRYRREDGVEVTLEVLGENRRRITIRRT